MTILAYHALEDKKAADISVIDIGHVSVIADYFLIASGENRNQVQAMADHVSETLGKAGFVPKDTEGYQNANWVLLDFGDLIVHIFDRENRLFYDLERIWRDGRKVAIEELAERREEEE
jgi:ribosome-associated protein